MISVFDKTQVARPGFIFVGDHPAIDFVNTLAMAQGEPMDFLVSWADLVDWLSRAGLSEDPRLHISNALAAGAMKNVWELRHAWKAELDALVNGAKVSDGFIKRVNRLLAEDSSHDALHRAKTGFHLDRSASELSGEKLALGILARQIAQFLAEATLSHVRRCANTSSCVLYFYDTTKNHRRQWCSTAACGNRHKVAEFRKRQGMKEGKEAEEMK